MLTRLVSRLWCNGNTVASQAPDVGSIPIRRSFWHTTKANDWQIRISCLSGAHIITIDDADDRCSLSYGRNDPTN